MIAALFLASWLDTQEWSWAKSPEPDVIAYRLYWGASGQAWCSANRVEVPATQCDDTRCWGEIPQPPFTPAFIVVTAVDSEGLESITEHGPIVDCP